MTLIIIAISFLAAILSLSVHEFAHAFVANKLGDHTAERAGRLTLNPLAHIDWFGTIALPILLALSGLPIFGWAKPVPYNPYNFRNQKHGPTYVGIAGPISNLILALLFAGLFHVTVTNLGINNLLPLFCLIAASTNISLAIFNILPLPPLDGSKILYIWANRPAIRRLLMFLEINGQWILVFYLVFKSPGLSWLWSQGMATLGLAAYFGG